MPSVPLEVRRAVREQVPVDVKVYVRESGTVEYAELLSGGIGTYKQLGTLAVYAARRRTFSPARIGPRKVPGEVVLHFLFGYEAVARR